MQQSGCMACKRSHHCQQGGRQDVQEQAGSKRNVVILSTRNRSDLALYHEAEPSKASSRATPFVSKAGTCTKLLGHIMPRTVHQPLGAVPASDAPTSVNALSLLLLELAGLSPLASRRDPRHTALHESSRCGLLSASGNEFFCHSSACWRVSSSNVWMHTCVVDAARAALQLRANFHTGVVRSSRMAVRRRREQGLKSFSC
mmetsp:Transcript_22975/g.58739  ORF Transcript_22975/g.58739 Transcript_22975/m.58739 type:complete len:201 (+) Transcript_22975:229-831(+)